MQATYSPLQGTKSLAAAHMASASTDGGFHGAFQKLSVPETSGATIGKQTAIISEMENLAIDSHRLWLDAFVFAPTPALVVSCTVLSDGGVCHKILQANSSAVMVLCRDAAGLRMQSIEDLVIMPSDGLADSRTVGLGLGTQTGLLFKIENCRVQAAHAMIDACLVLVPISNVCSIGQPSLYLALILVDGALSSSSPVMMSIPSIEDVTNGNIGTKTRKSMFANSTISQGGKAMIDPDHKYSQTEILNIAHGEAIQRRFNGERSQDKLPLPFDSQSWVSKFVDLLTISLSAQG